MTQAGAIPRLSDSELRAAMGPGRAGDPHTDRGPSSGIQDRTPRTRSEGTGDRRTIARPTPTPIRSFFHSPITGGHQP